MHDRDLAGGTTEADEAQFQPESEGGPEWDLLGGAVERPGVFSLHPWDETDDPIEIVDSLCGAASTLAIGDRTPTGTGAYARCGTAGSVRLVGLSLDYYAELLLSAAR